jgi:hypothetical protein
MGLLQQEEMLRLHHIIFIVGCRQRLVEMGLGWKWGLGIASYHVREFGQCQVVIAEAGQRLCTQ